MKAQNILIALMLLGTHIFSNSMNIKVQLPSSEKLKTYLQEYKELNWFIHDTYPELSADIPNHFGDREKSPGELNTYLWTIDGELNFRSGIMQSTRTHDEEILKTIYEIINLVFKDYPDLLKQINDVEYPASLKAIHDMHSFPPQGLIDLARKK